MQADQKRKIREAKALGDAEVLAEFQAKFDKFVAELNQPGVMYRVLNATPEHGQVLTLGPSR